MAELPFLVVHGALVWKAGVVGAGALVVKAASWMRDRRSAKFVRNATKHYTSTATGLEVGPILVRGHLRGGGAHSYEHSWLPVVHARDAGTYVDIEGERIDFDGEVVVGCGTENRTSYWRAPVGAPAVDDPMAKRRGPQRLSIVRAGDEVLVAGVLRRSAAGDADYRDSAGGWKIEPFPRQGAVGLVAKEHRARALPASPARMTVTFGVAALIALATLRTCGAIEDSPGRSEAAVHHLTIAAAMPGTRDDALEVLDRVLIDMRTPDRIDQAIELREMQQGCAAAIDLMVDEGRLEQALRASRRCGEGTREANALVLLGRYDEAARSGGLSIAQDPDGVAVAAIATGRWAAAAAAESDRCAAALFAALAKPNAAPALQGQQAVPQMPMPARAELDAMAERLADGEPRCALLGSQLLPPERRALAAAQITTEDDHDGRLADALVDLDLAHRIRQPEDLELAARDLMVGDGAEPSPLVWTSRPGDLTPARAVFETYRGDFDKAQAIAGTLIAQAQGQPQLLQAERFAALIAMRAGRPVPPAWLHDDDELPTGSVFRDEDLGATFVIARGDGTPSLARGSYGLTAAMTGDGSHLRDEWRELTLTDGMKLIAVLPLVRSGREQALEFARALRADTMETAHGPLRWIRAAAMRRDLARATGDDEVATSWQGVIDRHLAVVEKRDLLLGFLARSAR